MADFQRLECHLQIVRLYAETHPREEYIDMRRAALGACNKLLRKVPGEEAKAYVREIKRQIQELRYRDD